MATTIYSPEYLGDPDVTIVPLSLPNDTLQPPSFLINIRVVLTRPSLSSDDEEEEDEDEDEEEDSVELSDAFSLPHHALSDHEAAREAVSAKLSAVHAPPSDRRSLADRILAFFASREAGASALIHAFVDHLPGRNYDHHDHNLDRNLVGFSAAIAEALKSERITATEEEPVTCSICLDEDRVGSEMIRLLCSHCFHEDCIAKWFVKNGNNMTCPVCRCCFELVT